ncbi:MAG: tetratricopeptide repeat protein [Candidatus Zixiibacteriota bacterium]
MKNSSLIRLALVFALCAMLMTPVVTAQMTGTEGKMSMEGKTTMEGKIPITTSSKQAMEYFLKGRDLAERLRAPEARTWFEKAVAEDPDFALAHLLLAQVQPTARGFFEHLDKALALTDKVSEGEKLMILGSQAGAGANPMKQREIYTKLVGMYPNDERAHNLLGTNHFGQQEWDEAIKEYKTVTKINPDFSQAYNQMGYAYRTLEKYDEAEKAFQTYISLIPDDPNPYDSYAELLMKMGRYQESIENYRKALKLNPTFAASHIGIATNLNYMGKYKEARDQLQTMYANATDDGQRRASLFATAVSHVNEGNMMAALDEINKMYTIAQKNNDHASMSGDLVTMGNILLEDGQYDKALTHFTKSVTVINESNLDEDVKEATRRNNLYNEGRVAVMRGDLATAGTKAEQYLAAATKINNSNEIRLAHELQGMIAMEQKDYKTAHANLLKSNQQNPQNIFRMAAVYQGQGDKAKAKEMCQMTTNFNALNSLNQAFATHKAKKMMAGL